ncbi:MAG: FKBP-type peptidyl-prolyl cis-trans isomerase [Thermoanaerobaculia bacterium]
MTQPKTTLPRALFAFLMAGPLLLPAFAVQDKKPAAPPAVRETLREMVTPSGVRYLDLQVGQGDEAQLGKIVEVHYTGWLEDGTRFDSSRDREHPFTFRLGTGDAIKGWDEGLLGMKVGGKRKLTIPPELGFGKQGIGSVVPPNAILHYEFELLGVR